MDDNYEIVDLSGVTDKEQKAKRKTRRNYRKYSTEEIIQALRETNGLVSVAARRLGCMPQTIYLRAQKVRVVQEIIDAARDELIDLAEAKLRQAVFDGAPWAISLVLRTLGRSRGYGENLTIGVTQEPTKLYSVVADPKLLEKKDG